MVTIFGALFGLVGALLPKVIGLWESHAERKHELMMLELQSKIEVQRGAMAMREAEVYATARQAEALARHDSELHKGASQWVTNLAALVRPAITFSLMLCLVFLIVASVYEWMLPWAVDKWIKFLNPITSGVFSFWFGSRLLNRPGHPHT